MSITFIERTEPVDTGYEDGVYLFKALDRRFDSPDGCSPFQVIVLGPMRFSPGKLARQFSERQKRPYRVESCNALEPAPTLSMGARQAVLDRGFWSIVLVPADYRVVERPAAAA